MANKYARVRAPATPEVRAARGDIFRLSYRRAQRAIRAGFYLEAIALIESMMADRLESVLALRTGSQVKFQTVGSAVKALRELGDYKDSELLAQVQIWARGRSRWLHEFAKVSEQDNLPWRARIADARDVAMTGLQVLKVVSAEAQRVRRAAIKGA